MKKIIKFLPILTVIFFLTGCLPGKDLKDQFKVFDKKTVSPSAEEINKVDVILDFSDRIATFSGIAAKTAFEALEKAAQNENLPIQIKQYDFGILVQKIGDKENTTDKSWLYYVNGNMADKAADKYQVQDNDTVEWRYEKPKF